jgi:hypothetical protein
MFKVPVNKPHTVNFLIFLLYFQGFSGITGGILLIIDPSGALLNLPLSWLSGSPFTNFLVPGYMLFLLLGFGTTLVASGVVMRKAWAWTGSVLTGIALIIWILTEIMIIGYHPQPPLQLIYGLTGILILSLSLSSGTRNYLRPKIK